MRLREIITTITLMLVSSLCSAQTSDSLIVNQLRGKGVSFSHDNSVTLLMNGQEKFDDMFHEILSKTELKQFSYYQLYFKRKKIE